MSNKEGLDVESAKSFVDSLFKLYSQNSFGSVSKRELDLFLFSRFKELKMPIDAYWVLQEEYNPTAVKSL